MRRKGIMKKQQVTLVLSLLILFMPEWAVAQNASSEQKQESTRQVATANMRSRVQYLSQAGTSHQTIQSIQMIEGKVLAEYKISSAANLLYKRNRTQESQDYFLQVQTQFKEVAVLYNKILRQHLKPQQVAGYMNYLKKSQELIHIPGAFYSPYVLSSFIVL